MQFVSCFVDFVQWTVVCSSEDCCMQFVSCCVQFVSCCMQFVQRNVVCSSFHVVCSSEDCFMQFVSCCV